jgi:DNA repair protein RecO (recombination protein O)
MDDLAKESDPRRASAWFLMTALDLLGYAPQLINCATCDQPLQAKPAAFSPEAGGFLDERCALPAMDLVPLAAIKVLRLMASGDLATYRRLKLDDRIMASIDGVLQSQLEYHMDRRLKSLAFLNQLRIVQ